MSLKARIYISAVLVAGALLLLQSLLDWQFPDGVRFAAYFGLAMVAATLKVKLPGINGTFSATPLFILLGVLELSLCQTVILGCSGMIVQSLWKPKNRPRLIQLCFNVASLAICTTVAYGAGNFTSLQAMQGGQAWRMVFAACVFFLTNTILVSGVMSITQNQPFRQVWEKWFFWSFPYYLVIGAVAAMMDYSSRQAGWRISLLMLPLMYLVYVYFRLYINRQMEGGRMTA